MTKYTEFSLPLLTLPFSLSWPIKYDHLARSFHGNGIAQNSEFFRQRELHTCRETARHTEENGRGQGGRIGTEQKPQFIKHNEKKYEGQRELDGNPNRYLYVRIKKKKSLKNTRCPPTASVSPSSLTHLSWALSSSWLGLHFRPPSYTPPA